MAVAIIIRSKQDLQLLHWAARLATARKSALLLIWAQPRRGNAKISCVPSAHDAPDELLPALDDLIENGFYLEKSSKKKREPVKSNSIDTGNIHGQEQPVDLPLELTCIHAQNLHIPISEHLQSKHLNCLIMPRDYPVSSDTAWQDELMRRVDCEVIFLTPGSCESGNCRRIVSPVGEGPNSASCLRVAHDLVSSVNAKLVALHVTLPIDQTAKPAAEGKLQKSIDRALGDHKEEHVDIQVELSNNVIDGIHQAVTEETDLIILGIKRAGLSKRIGTTGLAQRLIQAKPGPTIAVVQSAVPISSRLDSRINAYLKEIVPQLTRERRIDLVGRIQSSSEWDFDFILLICLSTIIAAGGLIQNSAAVVIGAMLVAPLMTPLLGAGLAIVQGNWILFTSTMATVARGFVLALCVAFLVALVGNAVFGVSVTEQMQQRGHPSTLDLAVAMVGGIAAAYASGRPNLLSALPGVAIAAALVPPIATAGIAILLGLRLEFAGESGRDEFLLAACATLLFLTNIVAIVLGTYFAFRAAGIRGQHEHGTFNRWSIPMVSVFLFAAITIGILEWLDPFQTDRDPGFALLQKINHVAKPSEDWKCISAEYRLVDGEEVLALRVVAEHEVPDPTLDRIHAEVMRVHETKAAVRIVVVTNESESDAAESIPPP